MSTKVKSYCWTLQNPDATKEAHLDAVLKKHAQYYIFGRETAPTTGNPHLQGYVYFKSQKTLSAVIKLKFADHYEQCKGSPQSNILYCSKDKDTVSWGVPPKTSEEAGQMEKDRWATALVAAQKRKFDEIPADIYIKYHSSIKRIAAESQQELPPLDNVCGYWLYGMAGTGKSTAARTVAPGAYLKPCSKWWDGYEDQEDVIIEDFDKTHSWMAHLLKIWADKFSFPAEVKGGTIVIRPKRIIVTSNYSPQDIWGDDSGSLNPIVDRYVAQVFNGSSKRPKRDPLINYQSD